MIKIVRASTQIILRVLLSMHAQALTLQNQFSLELFQFHRSCVKPLQTLNALIGSNKKNKKKKKAEPNGHTFKQSRNPTYCPSDVFCLLARLVNNSNNEQYYSNDG